MRLLVNLSLLIISFSLLTCSKPAITESNSEEDTTITAELSADTVYKESTTEIEETTFTEDGDDFTLMVESSFDSVLALKKSESVYSMTATFDGYESSADATYYFDSALSITYCEVGWSMEGTSGTNTYIFSADQVDGGKEELSGNSSDEITVFLSEYRPRYGFTRVMMSESDPKITELDESKFISRRTEASNEYNRIVARMLEYAQSMEVTESEARLQLENEVDYGETFHERELFRLDIPVYEMLIVDID